MSLTNQPELPELVALDELKPGQIVLYERMCQVIAECRKVDEAKTIADKAQALQAYFKMAKNKKLETQCAEIRARAARRAGEIIHEMIRARRLAIQGQHGNSSCSTLEHEGLTRKEAFRYKQIASVPEDMFEGVLEEHRKTETPVTSAEIYRFTPGQKRKNEKYLNPKQVISQTTGPQIERIQQQRDPVVRTIYELVERLSRTFLINKTLTPEYIVSELPDYLRLAFIQNIDIVLPLLTGLRAHWNE